MAEQEASRILRATRQKRPSAVEWSDDTLRQKVSGSFGLRKTGAQEGAAIFALEDELTRDECFDLMGKWLAYTHLPIYTAFYSPNWHGLCSALSWKRIETAERR